MLAEQTPDGVLCRWYPTLLTLPSGNVLIVGGNFIASGSGGSYDTQNPTYQVLNSANTALSYKRLMPTSLLTDVIPYALYPLIFQLPRTQSILVSAWHAAARAMPLREDSLQVWQGHRMTLLETLQVVSGPKVEILLMNGDFILGQNRNYGFPPPLTQAATFPTMSGNVMLPLSYPNYTPEVTFQPAGSLVSCYFIKHGCACNAHASQ